MTAVLDARPVFALEIRDVGTDSPRRARHWLTWVLETAGVSQTTIETASLLVSELVTNAVLHSDSPRVLVSAELVEGGLLLIVHDDAVAGDWQKPGGELAERGRGLLLVRALAEVDIDRHAHGVTVTALIPRTAL